MKNKFKLTNAALIAAFAFTSCMKEPMACCEVPSTGTIGQTINFSSSCSMDASVYEWNFGDGGTSKEANPTHSYTAAGTFTVKLMAMSKNGKKMNETNKSITIN